MSPIARGDLPADCKKHRFVDAGGTIVYKYMRIYLWSAPTVEFWHRVFSGGFIYYLAILVGRIRKAPDDVFTLLEPFGGHYDNIERITHPAYCPPDADGRHYQYLRRGTLKTGG